MYKLVLLSIIIIYFGLLFYISYKTGKKSNNDSFFIGNKKSNWILVAFGMIGTSLSGVTFVSVPGAVGKDNFGYLQMTIGYVIGYIIIAYILLPLYYRLNLISIYTYLNKRMGEKSEKTGAIIFIISRLVGSTAKLYLVVNILQIFILDALGISYIVTSIVILIMIILYTYKGGVKTIVYTDTLQTLCMLLGLVICGAYMLSSMDLGIMESLSEMKYSGYANIFETNYMEKNFFVKQIIAGMFITIAMTGIDQEMMQKSLSVSKLKDSQKNMLSLGFMILVVISIFLYMGGLLHLYGDREGLNYAGDFLFPTIAIDHMPPIMSIIFIIALISALFPSADGAMTAMSSSFCIDILKIKTRNWSSKKQEKTRKLTHLSFAVAFLIMLIAFKWINNDSMIGVILKLAGLTYGPLLGLFVFGIFTKYKVKDKLVPYICVIAPTISYFIDIYQEKIFGDFKIGLELIVINGMITFIGLFACKEKE